MQTIQRATISAEERALAAKTLNQLIAACKDAQGMYGAAAEDSREPDLQELFLWNAQQRARFATELSLLVREIGCEAEETGTSTGSLWRGLMDVKAALTGNGRRTVLAECERAEDRVKKAYQEALKAPLAWEIQNPIRRQLDILDAAHQHIRSLRDAEA